MRPAVFALGLMFVAAAEASPLFEDDTVMNVTLSGPLEATFEDGDERRQRPFTISVDGRTIPVQVRLRGKSRTRVCSFPPLRLNFASEHTVGTPFEGQDKLKLVTHCKASSRSETDILEEFVAYRILNAFTDISYRTRLLRVRYEDTGGGKPEVTERHGFLIESDEGLAARLGLDIVEQANVTRGAFDAEHAAVVYVFQYLIGNTDWSLVAAEGAAKCCHNGDLFRGEGGLYFLPYDFDLSGIVNARYAKPDRSVGIRRVTQRAYRGYCLPAGALAQGVDNVVGRRDAMFGALRKLPAPAHDAAVARFSFLESFFEEAGEADMLDEMREDCL